MIKYKPAKALNYKRDYEVSFDHFRAPGKPDLGPECATFIVRATTRSQAISKARKMLYAENEWKTPADVISVHICLH